MSIFAQFCLHSNIPENLLASIYHNYLSEFFLTHNYFYMYKQYEILRYLDIKLQINKFSIYCAIKIYQNCEFVKYLISLGAVPTSDCINVAAKKGSYKLVKLFIDMNIDISSDAVYLACKSNNIEIVKLLVNNGADIQSDCLSMAAKKGNIQIIKFLMSLPNYLGYIDDDNNNLGNHMNSFIVGSAAKNAHNELIVFLLNHGARMDLCTIQWAVENNHIDTVKLLFSFGCPMQPYHLNIAANCGNFEMFRLLESHESHPVIPYDCLKKAIHGKNIELVEYILSKITNVTSSDVCAAIDIQNIGLVRRLMFICEKKDHDIMLRAILSQDDTIIKIVLSYGLTVDEKVCDSISMRDIYRGNIKRIFTQLKYT